MAAAPRCSEAFAFPLEAKRSTFRALKQGSAGLAGALMLPIDKANNINEVTLLGTHTVETQAQHSAGLLTFSLFLQLRIVATSREDGLLRQELFVLFLMIFELLVLRL